MKRINKRTGVPYKQSDEPTVDDLPSKEGRSFYRYEKTVVKRDGFFLERWLTDEDLRLKKNSSTKFQLQNLDKYGGIGKFELNPVTNKKWSKGEKCPERGYFHNYMKYVKNNGYNQMIFCKTFDQYERKRITSILSGKPNQCRVKKIPYKLSIDYVVEIFPKDYLCPILKTKMKWGNTPNLPESPSLDRIIPEIGYVEGNVIWISNHANKIKSDTTFEEFTLLYEWFLDKSKDKDL